MANYVKATDFASKDGLLTGDPLKIVSGTEIDDEYNAIQTAINSKANTNSASFTGSPTAPTATTGTNTTQIATTAFVKTADDIVTTAFQTADSNLQSTLQASLNLKANIASPALTGVPTAPTAAGGSSSTQLATTAFVGNEIELKGTAYISFNSQTGAVIASKNLIVSRTGEGSYRVTLDASIQTGNANYAAAVGSIDGGGLNSTTFNAAGLDVEGIGVTSYTNTYFDIRATRRYTTGLAANLIGNDGNHSHRFAQVLLDPRGGRITAWVF